MRGPPQHVLGGLRHTVITLTALSRAGTLATATTATPHGFATGDSVTIAGATAGNPPNFNGAKTVTVTGPSTFTYAVTNGGVTTSGTGTRTATLTLTANRFTFRGARHQLHPAVGERREHDPRGPEPQQRRRQRLCQRGASRPRPATPPPTTRINLLARTTGNTLTETFDPDGPSTVLVPVLDHPSPERVVTTYNLDSQKFWNGETVFVDASGNACDIVPGAATPMPSVTLQLTTNCATGAGAADATKKATFSWVGAAWGRPRGAARASPRRCLSSPATS